MGMLSNMAKAVKAAKATKPSTPPSSRASSAASDLLHRHGNILDSIVTPTGATPTYAPNVSDGSERRDVDIPSPGAGSYYADTVITPSGLSPSDAEGNSVFDIASSNVSNPDVVAGFRPRRGTDALSDVVTPTGLTPQFVSPEYEENLVETTRRTPLGYFDRRFDMVGDTDENDAYERFFIDNGASVHDVHDMSRGDSEYQIDPLTGKPSVSHAVGRLAESLIPKDADEFGDWFTRTLDADATIGDYISAINPLNMDHGDTWNVVDDGTSYDYPHVTSLYMTGEQYLRYQALGMGGRPSDEIVPSEIYSKATESNDYGFTPYLPDGTALSDQVITQAARVPHMLASNVGQLRTNRPFFDHDYTIIYGDDQTEISGNDFDRYSTPYLTQIGYDMRFDMSKFLHPPQDTDNYTTYVLHNDVNGEDHYGTMDAIYEFDDGSYAIEFSDGSVAAVDQGWINDHMDENGYISIDSDYVDINDTGTRIRDLDSLNDEQSVINGQAQAGVLYIPNLRLSDGTDMRYMDVRDVAYDRHAWDTSDGVSYDFVNGLAKWDDDLADWLEENVPVLGGYLSEGIMGLPTNWIDNRPSRLSEYQLMIDGELNRNFDWANNAIDWTLGSIPISNRATAWPSSISSATVSNYGIDQQTYNPETGSYGGFVAGNLDDEGNYSYGVYNERGRRLSDASDRLRANNMLGNMVVPFTEEIVGPVGSDSLILSKIFGKDPIANARTYPQLAAGLLSGMLGEGIEEDLGYIFDEFTNYGYQGAFANPVGYDNEGNPITDDLGHEIRDFDTPIGERLANLWDPSELVNNFIGGALVSGVMTAPSVASRAASIHEGSQFDDDGVNELQTQTTRPRTVSGMNEENTDWLAELDDSGWSYEDYRDEER